MRLSHFHAAAFGFFVASTLAATVTGNGVGIFTGAVFAILQVFFFKRAIELEK